MVTPRMAKRNVSLFAGPRDGEETLLEVADDRLPQQIPDEGGGYYQLNGAGPLRRGKGTRPVYRWVPPGPMGEQPGEGGGRNR